MSVKRLHIALLMMVAFFCATPIYAQKPLTKPEKPQTQSPSSEKKVSVEKGKMQTTSIEMDTIPQYIYKRKALYDALKSEYNIGNSFEEFSKKMDSEEKRRALYDGIKDRYNVGDWDEFNAKIAQPKEK